MKKNGTAISYENSHRPHLIYHRRPLSLVSFSFSPSSSRSFIHASRLNHLVLRHRHPPSHLIPVISYRYHPAMTSTTTQANTDKNKLNKTARSHQPHPRPAETIEIRKNKTPSPQHHMTTRKHHRRRHATHKPPPTTKATRQNGTRRDAPMVEAKNETKKTT